MNLKIFPSKLSGDVVVPASKSITHRYLICAALSRGKSVITNPLISEDTMATIDVLKELGAKFKIEENRIIVKGCKRPKYKERHITVLESATTLRILLPILVIFSSKLTITSTKRLIDRIYTSDLMDLKGLEFQRKGHTLTIRGSFTEDILKLSGKITTQLISGIIIALAFLGENRKLVISDTDYNNPYILLTLDAIKQFGINYIITSNEISVTNYQYIRNELTVEGDFSNGAVWVVASYFHDNLNVLGLNPNSLQGDRRIIDYFKNMGVEFMFDNNKLKKLSGSIKSTVIDINETPDLAPILVALSAVGSAEISIIGTTKLKYKESNRKLAIMEVVNSLGGRVKLTTEGILINGKDSLKGDAIISSYNDHRIVMAAAILATIVNEPIIINDIKAVNKSYPNFFTDLAKVGALFEVV